MRPSYLYNGKSYVGKTASLYWISLLFYNIFSCWILNYFNLLKGTFLLVAFSGQIFFIDHHFGILSTTGSCGWSEMNIFSQQFNIVLILGLYEDKL